MEKLDFYDEIIVVSNNRMSKYVGKKGVVLGISQEDDVLYGYAIDLFDYPDSGFHFEPCEIKATGVKYKREDFY